MNKDTIKNLAEWIEDLKEAANNDERFSISWFKETEDKPFSIVGGWDEGFSADYNDILYISRSNPTYAMCVKIAVNKGPYAYTDFEMMDMPTDSDGDIEDTCISLELNENAEALAMFLYTEWERIMKEYGGEC